MKKTEMMTELANILLSSKKDKDSDTSSYKEIIFNKKKETISLFDEIDKRLLSISNELKRNYMMKCVVYKISKKIIEIQVNQSDLLVSMHRDIKEYDYKNILQIRKGYEKSLLCYYIKIDNYELIDYIVEICGNLIICPKKSLSEQLYESILNQVNLTCKSISSHDSNKGLILKNKRNFAIL